MSPSLADFKYLDNSRQIPLKVADRVSPHPAVFGVLQDNNLGMREGLYHPSLDRLIVSES